MQCRFRSGSLFAKSIVFFARLIQRVDQDVFFPAQDALSIPRCTPVAEEPAVAAIVTVTDGAGTLPAAGRAQRQIAVQFRGSRSGASQSVRIVRPARTPGHEVVVTPVLVMVRSFFTDDHFRGGMNEDCRLPVFSRPDLIGKPARRQCLMNAVDFRIAWSVGTLEKRAAPEIERRIPGHVRVGLPGDLLIPRYAAIVFSERKEVAVFLRILRDALPDPPQIIETLCFFRLFARHVQNRQKKSGQNSGESQFHQKLPACEIAFSLSHDSLSSFFSYNIIIYFIIRQFIILFLVKFIYKFIIYIFITKKCLHMLIIMLYICKQFIYFIIIYFGGYFISWRLST